MPLFIILFYAISTSQEKKIIQATEARLFFNRYIEEEETRTNKNGRDGIEHK